MLPSRFASVRSKHRPAATTAASGPAATSRPLREETSVVGFRYEKTKPAEPPIPLPPPKNPLRSSLSSTTISRSSTAATIASRSTRPSSVSSSSSATPVVVAPPAASVMALPGVAPPSEQHPALRSPVPDVQQQGKRDSGHAATSASDNVIHEEDGEDEMDCAAAAASAAVVVTHASTTATYTTTTVARMNKETTRREHDLLARPPEPAAAAAAKRGPLLQVAVDLDRQQQQQQQAQASSAAQLATPQSNNAASQSYNKHLTPSPPSSSPSSPPSSPSPPRKLVKRSSVRLSVLVSKKPVTAAETLPSLDEPAPPLMRGSVAAPASCAPQPVCDQDNGQFAPLFISIPTENLLDDAFMTGFSFSKRGSLMFGGKRATVDGTIDLPDMQPAVAVTGGRGEGGEGIGDDDNTTGHDGAANGLVNGDNHDCSPDHDQNNGADGAERPAEPSQSDNEDGNKPHDQTTAGGGKTVNGTESLAPLTDVAPLSHVQPPPDIRVLPPSFEKQSQEVRLLYETRDMTGWEDGARFSFCEQLEPTPEVLAEDDASQDPNADTDAATSTHTVSAGPRCPSSFSQSPDGARRETELAGGLEDWEDVDGADVDRYGFIVPPRHLAPRVSTPTELKSAQLSPRRRHMLHKKRDAAAGLGGAARTPSRKVSARSLNTVNSEISVASVRSSRSVMRQAGNLLPHNRNRRWMDEAGEMLTQSPATLQDDMDEARASRISEQLKRKEWERSEKWRKMAKIVKHGEQGEGMEFGFDVKNPKLVERTWKGIPDRWRAAAWWSFLDSAAAKHQDSPAAQDIIKSFQELQEKSSPDDVQIDLDVPRTISRHIMFRRRYRGGQRLLFRVLHAISIYFPETGYVQGMASLAATLLCYFDEEKTFVMLVRIWQLRGLERLYRPGFEGLMTALREFESSWLSRAMSEKLTDLGIDSTAYGTRWYLTLFNLSIPFPAQLRVWDVFLLLGDSFEPSPAAANQDEGSTPPSGLDVLHAAGAALIEALREVLLDSDFENAMKALTSWIPIKDENLLMKVTKAEWKTHQGKKKT